MKNRYLVAFTQQPNLLGLSAVAMGAAAAVTTPWSVPVLVTGLALEASYLAVVPRTRWFEKRVARQRDAAIRAQHEQLKNQILPQLRPALQERFAKLEQNRAAIDRQTADDQLWMREVGRKLDYLLDKWLQFALKDEQFRVYLGRARREKLGENSEHAPELAEHWERETVERLQRDYDADLALLARQRESETDDDTRAILRKRGEVLARRRDFVARMGKIVANLAQQLALLEDAFGLISDEFLARSPEQVLGDIEDVVSQTKIMTEILEEMAPYERMLAAI